MNLRAAILIWFRFLDPKFSLEEGRKTIEVVINAQSIIEISRKMIQTLSALILHLEF